MKTDISRTELQRLNDTDFLNLLRKYPYQSQWASVEAWNYSQLRLCHIQGNRYIQTGNLKSFRSR